MCMSMCVYVHLHACLYVHVYAWLYVFVFVYAYVFECACLAALRCDPGLLTEGRLRKRQSDNRVVSQK